MDEPEQRRPVTPPSPDFPPALSSPAGNGITSTIREIANQSFGKDSHGHPLCALPTLAPLKVATNRLDTNGTNWADFEAEVLNTLTGCQQQHLVLDGEPLLTESRDLLAAAQTATKDILVASIRNITASGNSDRESIVFNPTVVAAQRLLDQVKHMGEGFSLSKLIVAQEARTLAYLQASIDSDLLRRLQAVKPHDTCRDLWCALQAKFSTNNSVLADRAKDLLRDIKPAANETILDFTRRIVALYQELRKGEPAECTDQLRFKTFFRAIRPFSNNIGSTSVWYRVILLCNAWEMEYSKLSLRNSVTVFHLQFDEFTESIEFLSSQIMSTVSKSLDLRGYDAAAVAISHDGSRANAAISDDNAFAAQQNRGNMRTTTYPKLCKWCHVSLQSYKHLQSHLPQCNERNKLQCSKCQRVGHLAHDCRSTMVPAVNNGSGSKRTHAHVAQSTSQTDDISAALSQ